MFRVGNPFKPLVATGILGGYQVWGRAGLFRPQEGPGKTCQPFDNPLISPIRPAISWGILGKRGFGGGWPLRFPMTWVDLRQCAQDALAFCVTHGGQNSFMEAWRKRRETTEK